MSFSEKLAAKAYRFLHDAEHRRRLRLLKSIGPGTKIDPQVSILNPERVSLGSNVQIWGHSFLYGAGEIEIEDHVWIAANSILTSVSHPIDANLRLADLQTTAKIVLKENCWLGAGVIVLPGVTIGTNSIVGAGSLVRTSIPDNTVAVGSPAKVIKALAKHAY